MQLFIVLNLASSLLFLALLLSGVALILLLYKFMFTGTHPYILTIQFLLLA